MRIMTSNTGHLARGIGLGRLEVKGQSGLKARLLERNINGVRVGLDIFLGGEAVRSMATAAFVGGIGGRRTWPGPGGVVGRVHEMAGAARTRIERNLPQDIRHRGRGER